MKQEMEIKRESYGRDDSIIIKKFFKGLEGGRALNIPDATSETVTANKVTTTTEIYVPDVIDAGTPIVKVVRDNVTYYEPLCTKKVTRKYADSYSLSASKAGKTETSYSYNVQSDGSAVSGQTYVGILQGTILKTKAAAAVMTHGVVNPSVRGYLTSVVQTKVKAACPHIDFQVDEEA